MPQEKRTTKVSAVLAGLVVIGVVCTMTFTFSTKVVSTINANGDKAGLAVTDGVAEKTAEVLNMTVGEDLRWAIFGFDNDRESIIPYSQGKATSDWGKDFEVFKHALPKSDIAAAVYNFPYWQDDDTYTVQSILLTFKPEGIDRREMARAGYFLGSILLSTKGVQSHFALESVSESYAEMCETTMGIEPELCALEKAFHNCPFDGEGTDETLVTPCDFESCDGATFADVMTAGPGTIPTPCCDEIKSYCEKAGIDAPGCSASTMEDIDALCANQVVVIPDTIITPEEEQICDEKCLQPCTLIGGPENTYKLCSACPTDGLPVEGQLYKCHPKALGFEMQRCCGVDEKCGGEMTEFGCGSIDYELSCKWMTHMDCPQYKEDVTRSMSPTGCCESYPMIPDAESSFAETVAEVDCGGQYTKDLVGVGYSFYEGMTCEEATAESEYGEYGEY